MSNKKNNRNGVRVETNSLKSSNSGQKDSTNDKKETEKVVTKSDLITVFIIFFLVFGIVGYIRGRSEKYNPENLRWNIGKQLQLRTDSNGRRQIVYQCQDGGSAWWFVDENLPHSTMTAGKITELFDSSPAIFSNESLTTAFVTGGGAASIFTARELIAYSSAGGKGNRLLNENHVKLIIVAVLATISGYEIGHSLALWIDPSCNDSRLDSFLKNQENWKWFESFLWNAQYNIATERKDSLPECKTSDLQKKDSEEIKLVSAREELEKYVNGQVSLPEHDFTSADFDVLKKYEETLAEFNRNCGNQP